MIIRGSINPSVSLLKKNIKELVKLYEILYGKRVCQQIVWLKKKFCHLLSNYGQTSIN